MTAPRTVDRSLRHGEAGSRWGNLVAPAGAFAAGDLLRFEGEEGVYVVTRVLPFPADPASRLVHCETAGR